MTGVRMTFSLDDQALRRDLQDRLARLEEAGPFLRNIGEEMLPRINQRFQTETAPDGSRWKALSPVTVGLRIKRNGNAPMTILRVRGHLAGSINYQVTGQKLQIGTDSTVEHYAGIHQFGGKAGRNRKVTIPARPYLGFSDEDLDVIQEETEAWLTE